MSKVVKIIVGAAMVVAGAVTGNWQLVFAGASMVGGALFTPKVGKNRAASSTSVQIGEVSREALVGRAATAGSLVDAFNFGGKYGTDWEVLVIALADHRCDALEGFYVNDKYVAFTGDGMVAGYNNQLEVHWRPGTENQTVPAILTTYGPGWTANDNGAGVCHVTVAYKADASDAKNPVWPGGRPRFQWVLRGARCYQARKDSSVGGTGAHRRDNPATWEWTDNPIDTRYNWARGFYACDRVNDQSQLLVGRGLSATEAPPQNVFARANLCDEIVGGEKRYTVGGVIASTEAYIEVEEDFAAACAGTIVQPEGCVEIDPGEARAVVATFTDDDIISGSRVKWNHGLLSTSNGEWVNSVVATYIEPAQKWAEHAAPVRRDPADIVADRQPREERIMLGFVTRGSQAGRIAEVRRRLGRLLGRAEVTLPPRFAFIEEGDWVAWQSMRRFGGATRTFRVEAWGSGENWHHQLTLRQISASVYSDTAPLDDGSVAYQPPAPPAIGAPAAAAWALAAGYQDAGGLRVPTLILTGASDDQSARFVRVDYVRGPAIPDAETVWTDAGVTGPDVRRREIPVAAGGVYYAAVSYVVDGVTGTRRLLGPVTAGPITYPDGTPVEGLQPAEPDATEGAVIPTPGSGGTGNVKDETGAVRPASDLLNTSLLLTSAGVLEIVRESGNRTPLGQVRAAAIGAAEEAAFRLQSNALERLSAVVMMIDTRLANTQELIRDAGVYVDPVNGKVTISAIDATAERINDVSVTLDAVAATLALKASTSYVDTAIAQAVIDPSQIPVFDGINARLTSAEVRLDGVEATLLLKADATIVDALGASLTAASLEIDALEGAIVTKVEAVTFDALETRVASAEDSLTALGDTAAIGRGISVARLVDRRQEDAAAATLAGLIAGDRGQREAIAALATAREEITTRLIDGDAAEAQARLVLAARVGTAEAAIVTEQTARASADTSIAQSVTNVTAALATETANRNAAVTSEANARTTADTALSGRIDVAEAAIVTETGARTAAIANEANARVTADGALATSIADVNAAVATEAGTRAAAVTAEAGARATADGALGVRIDGVEAALATESGTRAAAVATEAAARVGADGALGVRIDNVEASVATETGARTAAITTEANARVAGDNALAGQITTLATTVGGNTAAITSFAESVNGVEARVGVKLDVNGRVVGWVTNNDGTTGGMDIVTDYLRIWKADGTMSKAPFEFRNGGLYVTTAAIEDLSVGTLKLAGNAITLPVSIEGASAFVGPAQGEYTLVETSVLDIGSVGVTASALVGFYATLRTYAPSGGGPDNAADFKVYADKQDGNGYQLIGAQSVGIEITSGNAYYWIPVSIVDLISGCVSVRFKVTATAIAGPQGRAARISLIGAPTLVVQGAKR